MRRSIAGLIVAPFSIGVAFGAVNVNTAQQSELIRVKGIDKHKAKSLIEYRAANGPFDSLDDLEKVPGFSRELLVRTGPELTFKGDSYTPPVKTAAKDSKDKKKPT